MRNALYAVLLVGLLAACDDQSSKQSANQALEQPQATVNLSGKWIGVEDTYMIVRDNEVAIADLDRERTFPAQQNGETITFTRDGITETVHRGNGVDTGMKWLTDKKDCLVVKSGEGYCRD